MAASGQRDGPNSLPWQTGRAVLTRLGSGFFCACVTATDGARLRGRHGSTSVKTALNHPPRRALIRPAVQYRGQDVFDWITGFVEQAGYIGIALLMFAENVFPPIPSEVIMPLAGFTAARGERNIVLVVVAGAFGSLLGALLWYYIGKWVGAARLKRWASRHGRWMTTEPKEVDRACTWFRRHGGKAVFLGRLVPAVRTLISIPAGIAAMPLVPFLVYSAAGTVLWTTLLGLAGYALGDQYQQVSGYVGPVSNAVIASLVAWYLYRVATFRRRVQPS